MTAQRSGKSIPSLLRRGNGCSLAPGEGGFALPPEVAETFARDIWERKPALLSQPFATPMISPEEVFRGIVNAADQWRAGDEEVQMGFYVENAQLSADVAKHLPVLADRNTEGYAKRVSRMLGGRRFGLIVQDIQVFAPEVFLRFRDFLHGLSEAVDLPRERTKATVYLGDYRSTPFGLHAGSSSSFNFVVEGRKRMRVWPGRLLQDEVGVNRTTDYRRYLSSAISLLGKPGDAIYWPSGHWHVGESVGGLAVSVSLALFVHERSSLSGSGLERAVELAGANLGDPGDEKGGVMAASRARAIPGIAVKTLAAFRQAVEGPEFVRTLKADLLNEETGFGFRRVPPPAVRSRLRSSAMVKADPRYPIRWLSGDDGEIVCSANGHAFSLFAHPAALKLFERLNSGKPCCVKRLTERYSEAARADGITESSVGKKIRALLEKLRSLRALEEHGVSTAAHSASD